MSDSAVADLRSSTAFQNLEPADKQRVEALINGAKGIDGETARLSHAELTVFLARQERAARFLRQQLAATSPTNPVPGTPTEITTERPQVRSVESTTEHRKVRKVESPPVRQVHPPQVHELTDANFERFIAHNEGPILVDFYAPWCPPCMRMAPALEQLSKDMHGRALVAKVNVDKCPAITEALGIKSLPTLIVYKGGERRTTATREHSRSELEGLLREHIDTVPAHRRRPGR